MDRQLSALQAEQIATRRELGEMRRNEDRIIREVSLAIRNLKEKQRAIQKELVKESAKRLALQAAHTRLLCVFFGYMLSYRDR